MNDDYGNVLDNMQILYGIKDSDQLFRILSIITGLMVDMIEGTLRGAEYNSELKHDRLKIRVIMRGK